MKRCIVYIGKHKIVNEKRHHELSQPEIRQLLHEYNARLESIRRYPNNLNLVEYHFERIAK